MAKNEHIVSTRLETFYYEYLKKQANGQGTTTSELLRRVVEYQINKKLGSLSVSLDDKQLKRLNEIAREKGMSTNDVITRVVSNYIDCYF